MGTGGPRSRSPVPCPQHRRGDPGRGFTQTPGVGAESWCQGTEAFWGPAGGFTVSTGAAPAAPDPCPCSRLLQALSEGMEARPAIAPCGSGAPGLRRGPCRGRTATDGPAGSAKHEILVKEPKGGGTRPTPQPLHPPARHGGGGWCSGPGAPRAAGPAPLPAPHHSPAPHPSPVPQPLPAPPAQHGRGHGQRQPREPGAASAAGPHRHQCSTGGVVLLLRTARLRAARLGDGWPGPVHLREAWHGAAWHGTAWHGTSP